MLSFAPQRGAKTQQVNKQTFLWRHWRHSRQRGGCTKRSSPRPAGARTLFLVGLCSRGRRKMRANPGLRAQRASGAHHFATRQSVQNVQTPEPVHPGKDTIISMLSFAPQRGAKIQQVNKRTFHWRHSRRRVGRTKRLSPRPAGARTLFLVGSVPGVGAKCAPTPGY